MNAIRGYLRLAPLMVVTLMLTVAGCSSASDSGAGDSGYSSGNDSSDGGSGNSGGGGSIQASYNGPPWSDYLPARDGRVCTYSSSSQSEDAFMGLDMATETTKTLTYSNVHEESDGTHFTVTNNEKTVTIMEYGDGETDRVPITQQQDLEYVHANDGTLRAAPQIVNRQGIKASVDKLLVYPTIADLQEGESTTTSTELTMRSSGAGEQADIQQYLDPGESALKMRVTYTVKGVPPKEITTLAGTFTDVVGVSLRIESLEALNANDEMSRDFEDLGQMAAEAGGETIVWYAHDVGIVRTETKGGLAAEMMESTTSSEGAASLASAALKFRGCEG